MSVPIQLVSSRIARVIGITAVVVVSAAGAIAATTDGPVGTASVPASQAQVFVSLSPVRVLDTRPAPYGPIGVGSAGPMLNASQLDLTLAGASKPLPSAAVAAVINITLDQDASAKSFLTVWPHGETRPNASANNAEPGFVAANSMIAKLGADGAISLYNQQGAVNVVIDLVGYLLPADQVTGLGGSHFLVGSVAPTTGDGNDGDMYFDTTSKNLYGPKTGGAWGAPVANLGSGVQGPPGPGAETSGSTPVGACSPNGLLHINTTTGELIVCQAGTWGAVLALRNTISGATTYADSGTSAVAVDLDSTAFRTVATFTAPATGTYVLDGNVTVVNTSVLGVSALATTQCAWFNGASTQLGPPSSASSTIQLLVVSSASVPLSPTAQVALTSGASAHLQCKVTGLAVSLGGFQGTAWSYQTTRTA